MIISFSHTFQQLNVNPNIKSYLPSFFNIMKFTIEKSLGEIGKPEKLPYLSATLRNCAYYAYHNTVCEFININFQIILSTFVNIWISLCLKIIVISANMLAGVLYSKGTRPQYLNYGGLGIAIAHEMNHAFDLMVWLFLTLYFILKNTEVGAITESSSTQKMNHLKKQNFCNQLLNIIKTTKLSILCHVS